MKNIPLKVELTKLEKTLYFRCKEVKSDVAFKIVLKDFNELKSNCEEIRKFAIEEDEYEIITMIADNLTEFNKSIWLINSSLK